MEVEEIQSSSSTSSEASFMSLNSEEAHIQNEQRNDNLNANNENTSIIPIPTAESLPEVVLDSEEWHQTFPSVSFILISQFDLSCITIFFIFLIVRNVGMGSNYC